MTNRTSFRAFGLFCSVFLPLTAAWAAPQGGGEPPATLGAADRLFEKGQYQQALAGYEALAKDASEEVRFKALYRACESEALLFRYGEAVTRFEKGGMPKDPVWRARYLFLKTELYREFLKQYGYHARQDVVEGETEVFRKTPKELHQQARDAYWELWKLKETLVRQPVGEEKYFLDVARADLAVYPTLFDFLVQRWTEYLLSEAEQREDAAKPAAPDAAALIRPDFSGKVEPSSTPVWLAASLMEEGWRDKSPLREAARELWRVRRLRVPFEHAEGLRPFKDQAAASQSAASLLERWAGEFSTKEGQAGAGYAAAELYNGSSRYDDAVRVCEAGEQKWSGTLGGKKCRRLVAEIKNPVLNLEAKVAPPSGEGALKATTRNLREVWLRLYATDPEELKSLAGDRQGWTWSSVLNSMQPEHIKDFILSKSPARTWSVPVKCKSLYDMTTTEIGLKDVKPGLYLAAASNDKAFAPGESMIFGAVVNVTDLILVGSAGIEGLDRDLIWKPEGPAQDTRPAFHFYLLDGLTGKPVSKAALSLRLAEHYSNWRTEDAKLDELGRAQASMAISLLPTQGMYAQADPLAERDGRYAYWAGPAYVSFSVPEPFQLFVETDRPIYRPGQKVQFKVTAVQRIPQGFKSYAGEREVAVTVRDVNGQQVYRVSKRPGPFGTLSGEFTIPTGRLLGSWSVQAELGEAGRSFSAYGSFQVEEYKRPEFEVALEEAEGAWRFGKDASVKGAVKYYFGGPVPDAPVSYKVYRETWRPWFCWWWSWRGFDSGREEILNARTKTGADGSFSFVFLPQPRDPSAEDPMPARFTVEVEARDPGGRTIKAEKSYVAGQKAYLFQITPSAGFAKAGAAFPVGTKLVNLNEQPVAGQGRFELHRLEKDPKPLDLDPAWGGNFPESPSLDQLYHDVPDGAKVQEGAVSFQKDKETQLKLGPLAAGAYRLTLTTQDPWGGETKQSVILLSADPGQKKVPLKLSTLSLPERSEYTAGETAVLLLGSSELDQLAHVEVWGGQYLLERRALEGGGIQVFRLPLTGRHKGGVTVRWFGVKDFKPRTGSVTLQVPWKEKELTVKLKHDRVLRPGQEAHWSLTAADRKGSKVAAEAMAKMYDRSLEYYMKGSEAPLESLYAARPGPQEARGSVHPVYAMPIRVERGWIVKLLEAFREGIQEPLPPGLRLNRSRVYGGWGGRARRGMAVMEEMEMQSLAVSAAAPAMADMGGGGGAADGMVMAKAASAPMRAEAADKKVSGAMAGKPGGAPGEPEVKARTEFSETAFFEPHIVLKEGRGGFSFKAPEQLTSWRITGKALTRDLKVGRFSEEAVTRKDLMVRVEMPRFFREGDKGTLKAVVHNESDAELSGSLTLSLTEDEKPAAERLGLTDLVREFAVKPHGLASFSWPVSVPAGVTEFKVRAVARSGEKTDAEERPLPVLPSRQRLIDSAVVALNGDATKVLSLKVLGEKDPSRLGELLQLQVDPQLLLTVMNSLPFLVQYPHECVEQTLNRFVPMSIVHEVYRKYPAVAAAAAKIPKRTTVTPAWDRDDTKRLTSLMESPWLEISKGRKSWWPVIDMFDSRVVQAQKEDALARLKAAQLPDGAFPWFPGGHADPYMTLLVLAGLSEAQHYGVEVPSDMVRGALRYVMNEVPRHLKPEEGNVAILLYAAYVVTSFPEELKLKGIPELSRARDVARAWLDFCDKHSDAMTQIGKAYAAFAYWRLGEKAKGDAYLDRAMDGAREDATAGVYWQPEKYSWLWYNDTLETHAFILRTLQTLRPKDPRIPGMVQWLVFNRKGTEWKSTKASAAAVFTLLDFLKRRGALDQGDAYSVSWGDVKDSVQLSPTDWLEKPLRWTRTGASITPAFSRPKLEKKGPGLAFASLTYVYTTEQLAGESEPGMINVRRLFFRRVKEGEDYHLKPLKSGDAVAVGDELEVQLKVDTKAQFEYVHLKDPRGAGFEAEELLSGWKWDQLGRYEEPRDSLTNFFISWLPHGEYILRYRVRPTTPGRYRIGAAVLQSMYSPEFAGHSAGFELEVKE